MTVIIKRGKPVNMIIVGNTEGGPASSTDSLGQVLNFKDVKPTESYVSLTEDDIAEEFAQQYGDTHRFDHDAGRWYMWTGDHWKVNQTRLAFDHARHLIRKHRGTQAKMATKKAAQGVEQMAKNDQRLAVTSDQWDRDAFLLGTSGGTVDLKTGDLKNPSKEHFITRLTAVTPAPSGTPFPVFKKFLGEATAHDEGLKRFLQQWAGYCLTGDTREHALLFVYGPGGNGKSVLQNAISEIMGDYAKTAAMETLRPQGIDTISRRSRCSMAPDLWRSRKPKPAKHGRRPGSISSPAATWCLRTTCTTTTSLSGRGSN